MSVLQKNKKVAAGVGVAAVAAAALALGAGTYASFSDTEAGPGGTLAAGTLTLDITSNPSGVTEIFSASGIAPGYTSGTRTITIKNSGNIDGKLTGTLSVTGGPDLDDQIGITGNCGNLNVPPGATLASLSGPAGNFLSSGVALNGGQTVTCSFQFTFKELADETNNLAQGESVVVTSNLTLTQDETQAGS
ncbi:hypothetical protein I4I73_17215 [Pseudonocardia sp. KRD-184]|uniref:Camelysin-like metallo-endopeptidase n=1 Tax=Pseudonocardia oceani TaxID=2792013 RepID=A0ABS6U7A4_9PSEU|nr:TasA family protein [Pseudonocardia oceani]MBW0091055.1 hypothetical protein [Pseudonocardia oceani]MBW0097722.1 hypothetical protein [Pseudonocardia oceani]MBW0110252.1 hypothetical protein [Pseudonocardia oceani]MBW0122910.1 hypothetical protein [Pseudonocardia oceani]MBW0128116.1 hypothetical protein [Pseudonocardia oceani]